MKKRSSNANALPCSSKRIAHIELFRPRSIVPRFTTSSNSSSRGGGGEQDDNDDDATKAMTSSTATSSHTGHRRRNNKPLKKMHLLFLALYLHQIYWLISTSGTPYKLFLDKAEREGFEGELPCMQLVCTSRTSQCHKISFSLSLSLHSLTPYLSLCLNYQSYGRNRQNACRTNPRPLRSQ